MPRASSATKEAPNPKPTPKANGRPKTETVMPVVRYPELRVNGVVIPEDRLRFTQKMARDAMGWEAEDEYVARRIAEDPSLTLKADTLKWNADYFCLDVRGQKVRTANNLTNRDFRVETAKKWAQEILMRRWEMNGEPIIVSEYGRGLSLQHRCAGLVFACQLWAKDPYWHKLWTEEPWIPTLVVTGIKENPRVIQTYDCGEPRVLADTLITTGVFDDWRWEKKPLDKGKRKDAAAMLDAAVDLLWRRTGAGLSERVKYPTNQALNELRLQHPTLLKCAKHVFEENDGRKLSLLRLSTGDLTCLMYLMAASGDDGRDYRRGDPPCEELLTLDAYDAAEEFVTLLPTTPKIVNVLARVTNGDFGTSQLRDKRLAVLCKAWAAARRGETVVPDDALHPDVEEKNGDQQLVADEDGKYPNVGGIDLGMKPELEEGEQGEDADEKTPAEMEAARNDARERRADELKRQAVKPKGPPQSVGEDIAAQLAALRKKFAGSVLLHQAANGVHTAWEDDAEMISRTIAGVKLNRHPSGLDRCFVVNKDVPDIVERLVELGHTVSVLGLDKQLLSRVAPSDQPVRTPVAPNVNGAKPKPAPKGPPKLKGGTEK